MTRDMGLLRRVGGALLRFQRQPFTLRRWLVAADAFELADPAVATALYEVGTFVEQSICHIDIQNNLGAEAIEEEASLSSLVL
jgi:hypothetical protein